MARRSYPLVRWFFLIALVVVVVKSGYDLLGHPAAVSAGGETVVYLALFALAVGIYGWFALYQTRAASHDQAIALQWGTLLGLLCGGVWIVEVLVADVWGAQSGPLNRVLYFGSTLLGFFLPGVAGLLAGWRTRQIGPGLRAALLTGMFGGLILFLATVVPLSALLHDSGLHDAQTIREFQRSGMPDIATYIVSDYLAAMIAHLWIGLIAGLLLGGAGGALGKALAPPRRADLRDATAD